jgi:hypothetical protein
MKIIRRNFYRLPYLIRQKTNFTYEALRMKGKVYGSTVHAKKSLTPLTFGGHVIGILHNTTYLSVENERGFKLHIQAF